MEMPLEMWNYFDAELEHWHYQIREGNIRRHVAYTKQSGSDLIKLKITFFFNNSENLHENITNS